MYGIVDNYVVWEVFAWSTRHWQTWQTVAVTRDANHNNSDWTSRASHRRLSTFTSATVWPRWINFACGGPLRSFELWVRRSRNMIMKSACPTCVLQRCHAGRKLPMTRHVVGLGLQRWRCGQGPHSPGHRQRPLAPAGCVLFPYHDVTLIWRGRTIKMKWNEHA